MQSRRHEQTWQNYSLCLSLCLFSVCLSVCLSIYLSLSLSLSPSLPLSPPLFSPLPLPLLPLSFPLSPPLSFFVSSCLSISSSFSYCLFPFTFLFLSFRSLPPIQSHKMRENQLALRKYVVHRNQYPRRVGWWDSACPGLWRVGSHLILPAA